MKHMALWIGSALIVLAGCALEPKQSGEASTTSVAISGFSFQPGTAHVSKGQTVTFTNKDSAPHRIQWTTVPAGGLKTDSTNLGQGADFTYAPAAIGQYDYQCGIHPSMKGTLVVASGTTP